MAVVGTGLIGGSILRQLRGKGFEVVGWDPDAGTRDYGREMGLRFADELEDALAGSDVVFLACPLGELPSILDAVAGLVHEGCLVTDVGSTKGPISRAAEQRGLSSLFLPGHPMAGTERSGLAAADPSLFDGAPWVLCPYPDTPLDGFRRLAAILIHAFGARVVPMDPATHDATVALSSHIPHLLAAALAGGVARSPLRASVLGLAAGSFRDGSRVAGTPGVRTADMLLSNREAVLAQCGSVRAFLDDLIEAVASDDAAHLLERLAAAREVRLDFLGRELVGSDGKFQTDATDDEEYRFLMELGAAGGYLTDCRVDGAEVSYGLLAPPSI